jgi:hypothetical protein
LRGCRRPGGPLNGGLGCQDDGPASITTRCTRVRWIEKVIVLPDRLARAAVSSALLNAADTLVVEFPHVPHAVIYEKVGEARAIAARTLPNVEAYRAVLEREARLALADFGSVAHAEMAPGTSGLA